MIYQEKRDIALVKEIVAKYTEVGKIPITEVHEWFKIKKNLPPRTFQWYVKEELLPTPDSDGRNNFYKINDFLKLVQLVFIIQNIKEVPQIKFSSFRNILRIHKNDLRRIIDALLNLIEQYPYSVWDDEIGHPIYYYDRGVIWQRTISALEKGVDPDSFRVTDIEEDLEKEKLAKKG